MPSYDELYAAKYKKPVPVETRATEVRIWNELLDKAIEEVAIAKDEFVLAQEYESAVVARDLAETLREMRTDATPQTPSRGDAAI